MNSRERLRAALSGGETDRAPFFPCIAPDHACVAVGRRFEEAIADPRLGVRWMLEANLLYGSDATRVRLTPPRSWFEEKEVRREGRDLVQVDRAAGEIEGVFDVQGGGGLQLRRPPEPVLTADEAQRIPIPTADELIASGQLDAAREIAAEAHERGLFVVGMASSQTLNFLVERMGDSARALMALADDPDFVREMFRVATDLSIQRIEAFARVGVDGIYIGDSYASGSVISPRMYEDLCSPAYRRAADAAHARGLLVYKHCCGDYRPLLAHVVANRVDGMEGIDPTRGMSVAQTRAVVGDALCLIGGVSCLTLLNGAADEVYREARECVAQGGAKGRYVLGSACAVPRFTPPDNMRAMARAAHESGPA